MASLVADPRTARRQPKTDQSQKSKAAAIVASFGAGLASLSVAPGVDASVINLTIFPDVVNFETARSAGDRSRQTVLPGTGPTDRGFTFFQLNDQFGKTFYGSESVMNFRTVVPGELITAGQNFAEDIYRNTGFVGTSTFAFFYWPFSGLKQVGWIRISFGGVQGPVTYLAAAVDSRLTHRGGRINAGQVASAPEPTSLALMGLASLALGARGVRRWRATRNAS